VPSACELSISLKSPRAPSALYKLGLLAEQRGDKATARTFYSRVITVYPRSPEADLAAAKSATPQA